MKKAISFILIGVIIVVSSFITVFSASPQKSNELYTSGRTIMYGGKVLSLKGVNITELSWSSYGDGSSEPYKSDADISFNTAVNSWNCNLIRIAVNPDFYLYGGTYKNVYRTAEQYRDMVDRFITVATDKGIAVVLDCHTYDSITNTVMDFWKTAAPKFDDNGLVMYGLLNEPTVENWSVYYEGGTVNSVINGNSITVMGMPALLDCVRELSDNVVVIGGIDFAFDLGYITKEDLKILGSKRTAATGLTAEEYADKYYFCRTDRLGNGIVFDSHIYYAKYSKKDAAIGSVAEQFPILIGEYGPLEDYGTDGNTVLSTEECDYLAEIHRFINENRLASAAWGMGAAPFLTMQNGTTVTQFGEIVRNFLSDNSRIDTSQDNAVYKGNLLRERCSSYRPIAEFPDGNIVEHTTFYNQAHRNGNNVGIGIVNAVTDGNTDELYDIYEWFDHRMGIEFTLNDIYACNEFRLSTGYPGYPDRYKVYASVSKETLYASENLIVGLSTENIGTVIYRIDKAVKYIAFLADGYVRIREVELYGTVFGDINSDSQISARDLVELRQILLEVKKVVGITTVSDINRDGKINILDLIRLKKIIS